MAHHAEVVRDEQVGQVQLVLQVLQQVEDLGLDRHVERRDGLVRHDQPRVEGEGPGHADPLALAARELVRVAVEVLGVQARPAPSAPAPPRGGRPRCGGWRSGSPMICAHARAAGSGRRRDPGRSSASRGAAAAGRRCRDARCRWPSKRTAPSVGSSSRSDQPSGGRLAAPRLAHQPERLALPEEKLTPSTAWTRADLLLEDDPLGDGEALDEVLAPPPAARRAPAPAPGCVRVVTGQAAASAKRARRSAQSRTFSSQERWQASGCPVRPHRSGRGGRGRTERSGAGSAGGRRSRAARG